MDKSPIECTSKEGITVGLCDSIMTMANLLVDRLKTEEIQSPAIVEALNDLRQYESLKLIMSGQFDAPATPPPETNIDSEQELAAESVKVAFNSLHDSPTILFETGAESVLVVQEFERIPNTCSTTLLKIDNRELLIGVCEDENGCATAKFDVIIDGKLYGAKKFKIVSDNTIYKNTINLND